MSSPAYWGKLITFTASLRKPALIPFGLFSPNDDLSFIADMPGVSQTFTITSTPANGIRTTFLFSALPVYVVWNGVTLFQNAGYRLTGPVGGIYTVQFIDVDGNVLTPGATDDIRAATTALNASSPPPVITTRVEVAWASTLILDTSLANILTVTIYGDVTSMSLTYGSSGIPDNTEVQLRLTQDGVGGWSVALPTNLLTDAGYAINTDAGITTILNIIYDSSVGDWVFTSTPFSVQGG